jgi:hypothetical protein
MLFTVAPKRCGGRTASKPILATRMVALLGWYAIKLCASCIAARSQLRCVPSRLKEASHWERSPS